MYTQRYNDIIHHPHHRSLTHPPMSGHSRAAQFSSFAALNGYEDAVAETARLTLTRPVFTEEERAALDERMQILMEFAQERPEVAVTWFIPDGRKDGGAIDCTTGIVRRVDPYGEQLLFTDGRKIPLRDICAIEGELFRSFFRSAEN